MNFPINLMFDDFGQTAYIENDENWRSEAFHCFIQPLRYKNKLDLDGVNTAIGFNSEGHYLYIGPAQHDITNVTDSGTWIKSMGQKYKIDRAEKVYEGSEVFYIWAIIRKIVEVE